VSWECWDPGSYMRMQLEWLGLPALFSKKMLVKGLLAMEK
jgi:hypothetical protein